MSRSESMKALWQTPRRREQVQRAREWYAYLKTLPKQESKPATRPIAATPEPKHESKPAPIQIAVPARAC